MSTNEIENVDLLVVGGGKAGKSLAMERAKAGWKVAMVERQFVGGTCINVACIPTKSLVNSARRLSDARSDEAFGVVGTEGAHVDLASEREILASLETVCAGRTTLTISHRDATIKGADRVATLQEGTIR